MDAVIDMVAERLTAGETVMISGFGTFAARDNSARMGRNPKIGEAAAISARRVVVFRASQILKQRVASAMQDAGDGGLNTRDGPGVGQGGRPRGSMIRWSDAEGAGSGGAPSAPHP